MASAVVLRSDNSATVSDFNCKQTSPKRVDCAVVITGSGDFKLMATDLAGNRIHRNVNGHTINTSNLNADTVKPIILITAPTKISSAPITNASITVTDNQAISASRVILRRKSTATVSGFKCIQTNIKRVDCSMVINSSGSVNLAAIDSAGKLSYSRMYGFIVE